jgi:hypothetical protein
MGSREQFDVTLEFGQSRENALKDLFYNCTVEVKSDQMCRRTGNVFIEYAQQGKPSGIMVTKADYWAIEFDDDCWLFERTARLRRIAREVAEERKSKGLKPGTPGGDNNNVGVLIPVERLVSR